MKYRDKICFAKRNYDVEFAERDSNFSLQLNNKHCLIFLLKRII